MGAAQAYSEEDLRRAASSLPEGAVLTHIYAFPQRNSAEGSHDVPVAVPREQADRIFHWLELEAAQYGPGHDYAPQLDALLQSESDSDPGPADWQTNSVSPSTYVPSYARGVGRGTERGGLDRDSPAREGSTREGQTPGGRRRIFHVP